MANVVIPPQYRVRVKQRLKVLAYAEEHGLKPAARHFALSRTTVREWRDRRDAHGEAGLLPRYPKRRRRRVAPDVIPLVKQARVEHRLGADRTRIGLQRVHGISIAAQTIQRLFRDLGLQRLPSRRKRRPKQMRLFAKDQPGDSVQVDVKFVRVNRQRSFQYTALDDCTRFRVLRLYRYLITARASRSSASSARRCHFRSGNSSATTAPSFPSNLRSRSKRPRSDIATSRPAAHNWVHYNRRRRPTRGLPPSCFHSERCKDTTH